MSVRVVVPPDPVLALPEIKAFLKVETDDDDLVIESLAAAATASLDGPGGWLGRAIGVQTLEAYLPECGALGSLACGWSLPYRPVIAVVSVVYTDTLGAEHAVDPGLYQLNEGVLRRAFAQTWPTPRIDGGPAWRVRYTAGYAELPAPIRVALLLIIGDLYANRSARDVAPAVAQAANPLAESLLTPFRVWG